MMSFLMMSFLMMSFLMMSFLADDVVPDDVVPDVLLSGDAIMDDDGDDEMGVAWNDPVLAVPWEITTPLLSNRDQQNPLWRNLEPTKIPA